jgi:hypothetical protein
MVLIGGVVMRETLRDRIEEVALEYGNEVFEFNDLDHYTQKELLWLAFEEVNEEDGLDTWEYLAGFDMYSFMRSAIRGMDTKNSVFDMVNHTTQFLIKYINIKIKEVL